MARDWAAVAAAMTKRLAELDMTQAELVQRSRLAPMTIREILFNTAQRKRGRQTLEAIDRALDWPSGHIQALAEGRDPGEIESGEDPVMAELSEVKDMLAVLLSRLDQIERRIADDGSS
jgi:hypothetical protein